MSHALLAAALVASWFFWWPLAGELHLASDDRGMMVVSREIAAGRWERLFSPQGVQ